VVLSIRTFWQVCCRLEVWFFLASINADRRVDGRASRQIGAVVWPEMKVAAKHPLDRSTAASDGKSIFSTKAFMRRPPGRQQASAADVLSPDVLSTWITRCTPGLWLRRLRATRGARCCYVIVARRGLINDVYLPFNVRRRYRNAIAANVCSYLIIIIVKFIYMYKVAQKMARSLYALTSSNIDRFSNAFHCQNQKNICNNTVTQDCTTPQVCSYTTLWNISVLKATIEYETAFVTTHFKKLTTGNNVLIVSVII